MKFIAKKTASLSQQEINNIKKFLITAYQDEFPEYYKVVYKNPALEITVLMYDKNTLIGHSSIERREVTHKDSTYLIGGVGNVAILSKFQKNGHGTSLMKYTNKILLENEYDLGLLFCHPKLHKLYSEAGWLKKEKGDIFYLKNGEQEEENTSYIYPLNINKTQLKDWIDDDISIGEGSW